VNIDRPSFWFGVIAGLLVAAFIFEVLKWAEAHTIIIR
jgi:hypothetical protein